MEYTVQNPNLWKESFIEASSKITENLPILINCLAAIIYSNSGGRVFDSTYTSIVSDTKLTPIAGGFETDLGISSDTAVISIDFSNVLTDTSEILKTKNYIPNSVLEYLAKIKCLTIFAGGMTYSLTKNLFNNSYGYGVLIPFKLFADDEYQFGAYIESGYRRYLVKFNKKEVADSSVLNGEYYFEGCSTEPSSFEKLTTQEWYVKAFLDDPIPFFYLPHEGCIYKI